MSSNQHQWTDLNKRRNYPFTDASTLKVGSSTIPKGWALDAILVPAEIPEKSSRIFISSIERQEDKVTITIGSSRGDIASAEVSIASQSSRSSHIKFYNKKGGRYAGSIITEPVDSGFFGSLEAGVTRLDSRDAVFVPGVIHPAPYPSVTGVTASSENRAVGGLVTLVGGEGVHLAGGTSEDDPIVVNVVGDPYYIYQDCAPGKPIPVIEELKGIVPCTIDVDGTVDVGPIVRADAHGNFTILPSNVFTGGIDDNMYEGSKPSLRVYSQGNQLFFEIAGLGSRGK